MKYLTIIALLVSYTLGSYTSEQASAGVSIEDAVRVAYKLGREDAMYKEDDIGFKRLTLKDIEGAIDD